MGIRNQPADEAMDARVLLGAIAGTALAMLLATFWAVHATEGRLLIGDTTAIVLLCAGVALGIRLIVRRNLKDDDNVRSFLRFTGLVAGMAALVAIGVAGGLSIAA